VKEKPPHKIKVNLEPMCYEIRERENEYGGKESKDGLV